MFRGHTCVLQLLKRSFFDACRLSTEAKVTEHASKWVPVIGVEIHAQIAAQSKLFSGAGTKYGGLVNDQVAFLDAALPGTLPVLNQKCVEAAIKTALALKCHINMVSYFDRKHYFYADLPAGYQITQQRQPIAKSGRLSYIVRNDTKEAGIWQIQLEQDSGKSLHDAEEGISLIDLNRAGVGLMEIVTAPDFHSSDEVAAFVKELQLVLKVLGTCDCKMEEGSFRVDASVSLHQPGKPLGTRCEVKNLNSIRFIKKAIDFEIRRQKQILKEGGVIENETRSFDVDNSKTVPMRDKEKVHDYRFMPEPNLLPLRLCDNNTEGGTQNSLNVDTIRDAMPMLPPERRKLLVEEFGLKPENAAIIVNEDGVWEIFQELCSSSGRNPVFVADVFIRDMFSGLKELDIPLTESQITTHQIAEIVDLIDSKVLSRVTARKLFTECMQSSSLDVQETINKEQLTQVTDPEVISSLCEAAIRDNPHLAKQAKKGKQRHFMRLVNKVQAELNFCADPNLVKATLKHKLQSTDSVS